LIDTMGYGPAVLRLPVRSLEALLDGSGSPVLREHLHPDAAEFLYDEAAEHPPERGYRVVVKAPPDADRAGEVPAVLRAHFAAEAQRARRELRGEWSRGLKSLGFAVAVVVLLFLFQEFLLQSGDGPLRRMLGQSFIIISWVVLWIPLEALLFSRLPLRRRCRVLEALSRADVEVRSVGG
jgi:hypothetical protein